MAPRRLVRPTSLPAAETRGHVAQAQYKPATLQQLKGGQRKALQTYRCCGATAKDRGRNHDSKPFSVSGVHDVSTRQRVPHSTHTSARATSQRLATSAKAAGTSCGALQNLPSALKSSSPTPPPVASPCLLMGSTTRATWSYLHTGRTGADPWNKATLATQVPRRVGPLPQRCLSSLLQPILNGTKEQRCQQSQHIVREHFKHPNLRVQVKQKAPRLSAQTRNSTRPTFLPNGRRRPSSAPACCQRVSVVTYRHSSQGFIKSQRSAIACSTAPVAPLPGLRSAARCPDRNMRLPSPQPLLPSTGF